MPQFSRRLLLFAAALAAVAGMAAWFWAQPSIVGAAEGTTEEPSGAGLFGPLASCKTGLLGDQHITIDGGSTDRAKVVGGDDIKITVVAQNRASEFTVAVKAVIWDADGDFVAEKIWRNVKIGGGNIVNQTKVPLTFTWTAPESSQARGNYTVDAAVKSNVDVNTHCHGKEDISEFEVVQNRFRPAVDGNSLSPAVASFVLYKDRTDERKVQEFKATGKDQDGNLSRVEWMVNRSVIRSKDYHPSLPSIDASISLSFNRPGDYEIAAVFIDSDGVRSYSVSPPTWTVTVRNPPVPNVDSLSCSPSAVPVGTVTVCSATFRHADPSRVIWTVELDDESTESYSRLQNQTLRVSWDDIGISTNELRTVWVQGCNENGCGTEWERSVRVTDYRPSASKVSISPDLATSNLLQANRRYTFKASASDRDDNLDRYQWYIDDVAVNGRGGNYSREGSHVSLTRSFSAGETPEVRVTFTDERGNRDSVTWDLTVGNSPPSVIRTFPSQESPEIQVGEPQTFRATATDDDGNLTSWRWEIQRQPLPSETQNYPSFGPADQVFRSTGRASRSFPSEPYTFESEGTYRVTAIFTDSAGANGSATWMVEANDTREPPDLSIEIANRVTLVAGQESADVVKVVLTNLGGSPSAPVSVEFTLSNEEGEFPAEHKLQYWNSTLRESVGEPDRTDPTVSVGASEALEWYAFVSPPSDFKVGPSSLCAAIVEEPLKSHCIRVYVLPDTGNDFGESFTAYRYADWLPAGFRICFAGRCSDSTSIQRGSDYWILVPDKYPGSNRHQHVAGVVHSRAIGGYENREVRIAGYKELIREIASEYYSVGERPFITGLEGWEQLQVFGMASGEMLDAFETIAEALLSDHKIASEALNIAPGGVLHDHLHFLSNKLPYVQYVLKLSGWGIDVIMTEAINRSIDIIEAEKALAVLEQLSLDPAWNAALDEARTELEAMTGDDALARWFEAIDDNFPELVKLVAEVAIVIAIKKAAAVAIGTAAAAAGVSTLVFALPFTIAVGITIWAIVESIDQTDTFWDSWAHSSLAGQIYAHLYDRRRAGQGWDVTSERVLDYTEFIFYKQLYDAASTTVTIVGMDARSFRSVSPGLLKSAQQAAAEVMDSNWDAGRTISYLRDAKRPLDITSDGDLLWVMDGQSANDYSVYSFNLSSRKQKDSKKLQYEDRNIVGGILSTLGDSIASADPRGIWVNDGILWVADHGDRRRMYKFDLSNDRRIDQFDLPSNLKLLPTGGISSDGTTMWFTSTSNCGIVANNIEWNARDSDFELCDLTADNSDPYGIWVEGNTAWVSDIEGAKIYSYDLTTGQRLIDNEFYTVDIPGIAENTAPTGIWSDGLTMWVADRESDMIFAYNLPDTLGVPLNLGSTEINDAAINLSWQAPSDTGRSEITGYVVQESLDGETWTSLSRNTGTSSTSYSRTGLTDWNVRHFRVAAINYAGAGPWSLPLTVYQSLTIDSITCTPDRFYVGDAVDCSPTITTSSTADFTYAWAVEDGTATPSEDSASASIVWTSPGAKGLLLIACSAGEASDYIYSPWEIVGAKVAKVETFTAGACAERTQTILVPDLVPSISIGLPKSVVIDDYIGVGDSFDLEFDVGRKTWVGGPGGITVSFPDLTDNNTVRSANSYDSAQGRVRTDSRNTTFANVTYLGNGASQHLSVSAETGDWPSPPSIPQRTLRLRIQPQEAGEFRVRYRYWLCNEERTDEDGNPYCARYPKQDDTDNPERDQQGWATYEFTVTVVPKPEIDDLGCDSDTVDIGTTVTCAPTYEGGDIDSYRWRAGYEVAGGDPSSGSDANFTTKWGFSGTQNVELEVCNDISGCTSDSKSITVNPDPTETEDEEMMLEEMEEEEPDDGGRVLISGLASEWAHSSYSPTDTTIQVRALPTPDLPTLEFTLSDEDGFAPAAGDYVSPGALVLALPDDVWVDYDGISAEMLVEGTWVDYTAELEKTLLALETLSGGQQRTALTAQGLAPASVDGSLTPPDLLAWGLGETGEAPLDDLFSATHANCVSHVTVPWLALAAQTTAVRVSIPADVSTDDYVSLALAAITAEGEDSEEPTLVQAHDLLDTGDADPGCEAP